MAASANFVLALTAAVVAVISCRAVEPHESPAHISDEELFGNRRVVVQFTCPAIYGRYPHPLSCEYFFECRFGYPTLMHCNRGYLYDEDREQCRDRRKVTCRRGDPEDNKDKIPEKKEEIKYFKCPYIWGTFAHPTDCSKYFVCVYNVPTLFQCYGSDLFHDKARKCLPRRKVDCGKRLDKDDHKKFFCPFPSGRYADPEDCSRYYECHSSRAYLYQCPRSALYDERQEQCREGRLVTCGNRPGGVGGDLFPPGKSTPVATFPTTSERTSTTSERTTATLELTTATTPERTTATLELTTTTTPEPTTTTTPQLTTTTPEPTTTTPEPTTTTTPEPTTTPKPTTTTTLEPTTTTSPEPTTTTSPESTTITQFPVTKPNTPPPTDCDEDDLDCIVDETGDVIGWFDCPKRYGHFPHGSSKQLFIHCDNFRPFVKKCADETEFSAEYHVCTWVDKTKGV